MAHPAYGGGGGGVGGPAGRGQAGIPTGAGEVKRSLSKFTSEWLRKNKASDPTKVRSVDALEVRCILHTPLRFLCCERPWSHSVAIDYPVMILSPGAGGTGQWRLCQSQWWKWT